MINKIYKSVASPKREQFTREEIKLANFAKALAHPARIAILRHLASIKTCCFNEISKELPLADSTVSQHLSELKKEGLIKENFEPPKIRYCINYEKWKLARKQFKKFMNMDTGGDEEKKSK